MLGLATTADAGDCKTYAGYCPEVYRHGNCVIYIHLAAADFGHPSGAAYVRVTGMLLTHVRQLTPDKCCNRSVHKALKGYCNRILSAVTVVCHAHLKRHSLQMVLVHLW